MIDISKLLYNLQDTIFSMYFNKNATIIQKYWRRKDI